MAEEDRIQLATEKAGRFDVLIGLCRHEIGEGLYRRAFGTVGFHQLGKGSEAGKLPGSLAHVPMIPMALAGDVRIRSKDHVRLKIPDDGGKGADQVILLIERPVRIGKKTQVRYAQHGRGAAGLLLPEGDKRLRRGAGGGIPEAVSPIGADDEAKVLALGNELCRGGSRADLDIIGMGTQEEITLKAFQFRNRGGEADDELGQTHSVLAFLCSSSPQMRSYSGSSRM